MRKRELTYVIVCLDGLNSALCRLLFDEVLGWSSESSFCVGNVSGRSISHVHLNGWLRDFLGTLKTLAPKSTEVCCCDSHGRLVRSVTKTPLCGLAFERLLSRALASILPRVLAHCLKHVY